MKKLLMVLAAAFLFQTMVMAQSTDEKELATIVESMRKAMVDADKGALEKITSSDLSYSHSSGLLEDQATFVNSLVTGKFDFVKIEFTDVTIKVLGNTAVVRHKLTGDNNDGGKPGKVNIGVMLIFQKQPTQWKLIARQAYKL